VRKRLAEARKNQNGFTLIELLIVIVVLGILAGIVLFAVGNTRDEAESATTNSNERICLTAIAAAEASESDSDSWADFITDVDEDDPLDCSQYE